MVFAMRSILQVSSLVIIMMYQPAQSLNVPKVRWGQTEDRVVLTAQSSCPAPLSTALSTDSVRVSCAERGWGLEFTPRGALASSLSSCRPGSGSKTVCTLTKLHAGEHFDRLSQEQGESDPFQGKLSVDWDMFDSVQDDDNDEQAGLGGPDMNMMLGLGGGMQGGGGALRSNPAVTSLEAATAFANKFGTMLVSDGAAFEAAKRDYSPLFVYAQYPWCSECTTHHDTLLAAAAGAGAKLVAVDAREHRLLGRSLIDDAHGEACSATECHVAVFEHAFEAPAFFPLAWDAERVHASFRQCTVPAVTSIEAGVATDYATSNTAVDLQTDDKIPAFAVGSFTDAASVEYRVFASACRSVRTESTRPVCLAALGIAGAAAVDMYRDDNAQVRYGGSLTDSAAMVRWLVVSSAPPLRKHAWSLEKPLERAGCAVGRLIVDERVGEEAVAATVADFTAIAEELRPGVEMVWKAAGAEDAYDLTECGATDAAPLPFFCIHSNASFSALKYGLEISDGATPESVRSFAKRFLAGDLQPSRKSEAVPMEDNEDPGSLRKLVGKTFDREVVDSGRETLLLLYNRWASGDTLAKAERSFGLIAAAVHGTDGLAAKFGVFRYDVSSNFIDRDGLLTDSVAPEKEGVVAVLVAAGGKSAKRIVSLSVKGLAEALGKKSKALRSKKGKPPKAFAVALKAARKAAKEREIEAKARAEAAFEEELRKENDVVEVVDVTGDGGVVKYVTRAAEEGAETPGTGAQVSAHYHGTLLDGTKFDSSVDRGTPFEFALGTGGVIPCWDAAFATMRVGEKATLKCTSDNAYGDMGSPPAIPGGATLRFDVQLLSFEGGAKEAETSDKEEL